MSAARLAGIVRRDAVALAEAAGVYTHAACLFRLDGGAPTTQHIAAFETMEAARKADYAANDALCEYVRHEGRPWTDNCTVVR